MNMKKIILGCSVLATAALFIVGCNKKTNKEPEQDLEFQSSKDVAFANQCVADLDMICGYMGENQLLGAFFMPAPNSGGAITTTVLPGNVLQVVYSGSVTCKDGKRRDGTIQMAFASVPLVNGAGFLREPGYSATVTLTNFWVDGWKIDDVTPFLITNTMATNYSPAADKLNWTIKGEFTIDNVADDSKSMTWKGTLKKTCVNSTSAVVFAPTKLLPINWSTVYTGTNITSPGAIINYESVTDITGFTSKTQAYTFAIEKENPLVRDFGCAPDKVLGVITGTGTPVVIYSEWHPFVGGIANFTTSTAKVIAPSTKGEPRKINFSNDGASTCDNAGKVAIKGVDYTLDFMK